MSEGKTPQPTQPGGAEWSEAPGLIARGACMGAAEVIPGVSGGTMALILGIYPRLIAAIQSFGVDALKDLLARRFGQLRTQLGWRMLLLVGIGQGLGIVICLKGIKLPELLVEPGSATVTYGLFFGLVAGSAVILARDLIKDGLRPSWIASFALGVALALGLALGFKGATPRTPWFTFLCGSVAICAMILPGVSGSFLLLLLRQYERILGGVSDVLHPADGSWSARWEALTTIVGPFALGCVTGIVLFSRLLHWLLARYERATLAFMTGLLVGSLWILWPFQDRQFSEIRGKQVYEGSNGHEWITLDGVGLGALGMVLLGGVGIVVLDQVARGKRPETPVPTEPKEPQEDA